MTPIQGENQRKWYKMVAINGTYKHGRYEIICLNSLRVMSNVKFLPGKMDKRLTGQTYMTHCIDQYDTHMHQIATNIKTKQNSIWVWCGTAWQHAMLSEQDGRMSSCQPM